MDYSFNIFTYIKALYTKDLSQIDLDSIQTQQNMTISKWLTYNEDNIQLMKDLIKYVWFLSAKEYFLFLALNLPKLDRVPFLHKIETEKEFKESTLHMKIQEVFRWSKNELTKNRFLLDELILDKSYWKKELGV